MAVLAAALAGALPIGGCGTANTTSASLPEPTFIATEGSLFPLRLGDVALVQASGGYIYIVVQGFPTDTRCPDGAACAEGPGSISIPLDLETAAAQGSIRVTVRDGSPGEGLYGGFRIRILAVEPAARADRIPPVDYVFATMVERAES